MAGPLIIPFMVDESIQPIDFKAVDRSHVDACAQQKLCGVCGQRIRPGKDRFCFLGPARELECFGDPWMHEDCAEYTAGHCPFVSGKRRIWRNGDQPLTDAFKGSWMLLTSRGGKTHLELRHWHFQPVDVIRREIFERHVS